jgi:monoamine oxidase
MEIIAEQLMRIAAADQGRPRKRITVLGAGMAGLSAAYELTRLGHTVSVIEATGRPGGRVWTKRFSTGQYHELGGMRIPAGHDFTRYYLTLTGLTADLRPFVTAHKNLNCFYHLRGEVRRMREAAPVLDRYHLSAFERQIASKFVPPAIFGFHLDNTLKSLNEDDRAALFGEQFQTDRVAELERQSLGEFLRRRVESDDARELVGASTGLEVWWEMAITMFLRDEIVGTGLGLQELAGGLDRLPTELAGKLPPNTIRYNTEVVSIDLAESGVRLRTRPTDPNAWDCPPTDQAPQEETADFVVCTIPFGVLRRMDVRGFSPLKMRAIRNLNYASSTKVLLHCKERFWELGPVADRIFGGASMSDGISRATYYPSDHAAPPPPAFGEPERREGFRSLATAFAAPDEVVGQGATDGPGPGVLVGSYNWGRDARRLGALPVRERADAVIDVIRNFHPEIDKYVDDAGGMYWDDFRWSRGAFCFMQPGDLRDYYHDAIRPEGRVHFAGEHCSMDQGWIQGATMAGVRAVEEIVGA